MHFNPVIDGTFLPQRPYEAIRDGAADDISIIVGTTLDDTRVGLGSEPPMTLDYEAALAQVRNLLDDEAPRAMECYTAFLKNRGAPHKPMDVMLAIETDRVLRQPSILLSEALHKRGNSGHHFIVTYESPAYDGRLGAPHAIELAFIFGTHNHPQVVPFGGEGPHADQFATRIQDAWSSFARTGDPSCDSIGIWPRYGEQRETMMIGKTWQVEQAPFEDERQFWAEFPGDPRLGLM
jgi:para-nitrobenzyl esterase